MAKAASAPSNRGRRTISVAEAVASRMALMGHGPGSAYAAASHFDRAVALWRPPLKSADAEVLRDHATVRARARDLYRNHPYGKNLVRQAVHAVIGKQLRFASRVDWKFLGIDKSEARRWGKEFMRVWEIYAHGPGAWVDAGRRLNFSQFMRLALRTRMVDGETLVACEWAPNRRWKSCFQIVDVDRLSNPHGKPDSANLKSGVVLDEHTAPIGYYVRNGHPADVGIDASARSMSWSLVPRETQWGRSVMLHSYLPERAGQTRGISEFTTVMMAMRQQFEFTVADLASAIAQAKYALVIKSNADYAKAMEIIGADGVEVDDDGKPVDMLQTFWLDYMAMTAAYHKEAKITGFDGGIIPHLGLNEELQMVTPGNKGSNAAEFTKMAVKQFAAGMGGDPIATSQDYSDVNYSSARMSVASNWRGHEVTRGDLVYDLGQPMVRNFLEEVVFGDVLPLPKGVNRLDFYDALPALSQGVFLASGPPMLDPTKERQAQQLGWSLGLDTLEELAAEEGEDWEDKMEQKAEEIARMRALGIPIPGEPIIPPMTAAPADEKKGSDKDDG
jgi:lambda family phage portal protein